MVDLTRREELAVRIHAIKGRAFDELPRALECVETVEREPVDHREEEGPSWAQDAQDLTVRAPRIIAVQVPVDLDGRHEVVASGRYRKRGRDAGVDLRVRCRATRAFEHRGRGLDTDGAKAHLRETPKIDAGAATDIEYLCAGREVLQEHLEQHVHLVTTVGERVAETALAHHVVVVVEDARGVVVVVDGDATDAVLRVTRIACYGAERHPAVGPRGTPLGRAGARARNSSTHASPPSFRSCPCNCRYDSVVRFTVCVTRRHLQLSRFALTEQSSAIVPSAQNLGLDCWRARPSSPWY